MALPMPDAARRRALLVRLALALPTSTCAAAVCVLMLTFRVCGAPDPARVLATPQFWGMAALALAGTLPLLPTTWLADARIRAACGAVLLPASLGLAMLAWELCRKGAVAVVATSPVLMLATACLAVTAHRLRCAGARRPG
jgi:hypothetical protein